MIVVLTRYDLIFMYIVILVFGTNSCTVMGDSDRHPTRSQPIHSEQPLFSDYTFELINFRTDSAARVGSTIIATLKESNYFADLRYRRNEKRNIKIVFAGFPDHKMRSHRFTGDPLLSVARSINRPLAVQSACLIPMISYHRRNIVFEVWHNGKLVAEYRYDSNFTVVIGWVSFVLQPFIQSGFRQADVRLLTWDFLKTARSEGVFLATGNAN